jgi:hypothetical protein
MTLQQGTYPIVYDVDTPEILSRWKWLIKWILVIPQVIVVGILGFVAMIAVFIAWWVILFTGRYPRGLFDFVVKVMRWNYRINGYSSHYTDRYPGFSMDEMPQYPVRLTVPYPERSSRLTVFFRWFLAIPHFIILGILGYVIGLVWLAHILIVLFTGKPNADVFRFLVGYSRWSARVSMYLFLTTDRYPPFAFS